MEFPIKELSKGEFPKRMLEIPSPPMRLNYRGELPPSDLKMLAVVGSRKYTNYGRQVVEHLIAGLRGYNIGIVSGLALGIDSLAHEAALTNNMYTLAIPGGGLSDSVIYPARHKPLARKILENGGGMLSEYEPDFRATNWSFPERNRLVVGISHAVLVIEAGEKSGSLITARLCADYNRELLVVPGNIFSDNSKGVHQFLKLGATPVTEASDILNALNLKVQTNSLPAKVAALSTEEVKVLDIITEPTERDTLIRKLNIPSSEAGIILMQMEINGLIKEDGGVYYRIDA
ncbi:DNA-protecting protein DprA [Candidatus Nomurabacteria bacterium]|nr:DNA-protecting protein DprA [Candidatus Nomurabacteria bacterium]